MISLFSKVHIFSYNTLKKIHGKQFEKALNDILSGRALYKNLNKEIIQFEDGYKKCAAGVVNKMRN